MNGPLVDSEQFPRNDIDIPTVRQARHQIICLQNDHKNLMKTIEAELHKLHDSIRSERTEPMDVDESNPAGETKLPTVFARIDRVDQGSPAERAGLQIADEIVQFGSVRADNFSNLSEIGDVLQHSINKTVIVSVLRKGEQHRLPLKPSTWSGRGLLGCIIVPIKK